MITFNIPTKIIFGEACVNAYTGDDLKKAGHSCLIVTGRHSAKLTGALNDIETLLHKNSIEYSIFDKITENPEFSDVFEASKIFAERNCSFVIGIGGGSPIDAAKAVSVITANNFKAREIYDASKIKNAYPIITVPTTSGSGSEATPFSVLSDKHTKIKAGTGHPLLFPLISFVNPEYTYKAPAILTRDSGLDALSHLMEGIYSNRRNRLIFPIIAEGIKLIYRNLKKCISQPYNIDARTNMSLASLYGGMTIAHTSTTLQHSMGYPMTSVIGLTHGAANAVVMKQIFDFFYKSVKPEFDYILKLAGLSNEQLFEFVESFDIEIPKKFDCNINEIAEQVLNSRNMANNPLPVKSEDIIKIYDSLKCL